jgi:ribosomal protein S18 acetylase RimI-like enzyme
MNIPSNSVIEIATRKDFEAIADMNVSAYAEFASRLRPGSWETMQKNLRNISEKAKVAEFMVCRSGNEIVGSVAYCPAGKGDPTIFKRDMASILLLAVSPMHRGKGIARALTEACISRAKSDGANSIGLFTSELMESAQQIYRSLGFQVESEMPMRHGVRYFLFVLSLANKGEG